MNLTAHHIHYSSDTRYAIHFGAGNIGRGFIGKLLSESGYKVIFIDIDRQIIEILQRDASYTVDIILNTSDATTSTERIKTETVNNIDAIFGDDKTEIRTAIAHAHIITTSVGVNVLKKIAPYIAEGLLYRIPTNTSPINIIACENSVGASSILKEEITMYLQSNSKDTASLSNVGFPCCSVDRIVVHAPPESSHQTPNPMSIRLEEYYEWCIDSTTIRGDLSHITGANFTDNLPAYIERKLFTLNTGHAMLAYLGRLKHYSYIHEAIQDEKIYTYVISAMQESTKALIKKWKLDGEEQSQYIKKTLLRFHNTLLRDEVVRVGRDPIRKLGIHDRLIAPILSCQHYGLPYTHLTIGVAAALHFSNENDAAACELQNLIQSQGITRTIRSICGIDSPELIQQIIQIYDTLRKKLL